MKNVKFYIEGGPDTRMQACEIEIALLVGYDQQNALLSILTANQRVRVNILHQIIPALGED